MYRGLVLQSDVTRLSPPPIYKERASFPGPCVWVERKEPSWYTLFAHDQFPQDLWEFGNFSKIWSVTLPSARHPDFSCKKDACHWRHSVWTIDDKRHSALCLQKLFVFIQAKQLWHVIDTIFFFDAHWLPRTKQCRSQLSKLQRFWLQNHPYESHMGV